MATGVLGLIGGIYATFVVPRRLREAALRWWRIQPPFIALGVVLAVLLAQRPYSISETTTVVGIPFMVATFELHNGRWLDFVGPTTIPFYLANVAFSLTLPHLFLLWGLRLRSRFLKAA